MKLTFLFAVFLLLSISVTTSSCYPQSISPPVSITVEISSYADSESHHHSHASALSAISATRETPHSSTEKVKIFSPPISYHYVAIKKDQSSQTLREEAFVDGSRFMEKVVYHTVHGDAEFLHQMKNGNVWQKMFVDGIKRCKVFFSGETELIRDLFPSILSGRFGKDLKYIGTRRFTFRLDERRRGTTVTADLWQRIQSYDPQANHGLISLFTDPVSGNPIALRRQFIDNTNNEILDTSPELEFLEFERKTFAANDAVFAIPNEFCASKHGQQHRPQDLQKFSAFSLARRAYAYDHPGADKRQKVNVLGQMINPFLWGYQNSVETAMINEIFPPNFNWWGIKNAEAARAHLYERFYNPTQKTLPHAIDWRSHLPHLNVAGPIMGQGTCGSCKQIASNSFSHYSYFTSK